MSNADFEQYKRTSAKIKKRFLMRKPNFGEARSEFKALSRKLSSTYPTYAAICSLAAARCDSSLGNQQAELESLLEAARLFCQRHSADMDKDLNAAVHAYRQALKMADLLHLKPPLMLELAHLYEQENDWEAAAAVYDEAEKYPEAAAAYLRCQNWERALEELNKCSADQSGRLSPPEIITQYFLKLYLCKLDELTPTFPLIGGGGGGGGGEWGPGPPAGSAPSFMNESSSSGGGGRSSGFMNDRLSDLNIFLESLLMVLKMPPSEEREEDLDALMRHLSPHLNAVQTDLIIMIANK